MLWRDHPRSPKLSKPKTAIIIILLLIPSILYFFIFLLRPPTPTLIGSNLLNPSKLEKNKTCTKLYLPGVLVKESYGLGNQLFRYACSYALARKLGVSLYIQPARVSSSTFATDREKGLKDPTKRYFILDMFHIPIPNDTLVSSETYINPECLKEFNDEQLLNGSIIRKANNESKIYVHNDFCQSEEFFYEYREDIRRMFVPSYKLESVKAIKWRSQIEKKGTVSIGIHIRRGDYLLSEGL
jgi:hypothetical protein